MPGYLIFLFWIYFAKFSYGDSNAYDETVKYYENLIDIETNKAFHYDVPTSAEAYRPKNNAPPEDFGIFDYIVVGAGAAGAVIANRLSEIKEWKVLLLEAGGDETDFSDIPAMYAYLQGSDMNWGFKSVPQTNSCLGMVNHSCLYPRGKVMGGTTILNTIVYCRGNKLDYDKWAADGNPGWSYAEVLPFFKKSEHSTINGDPGYHGEYGPFNVEYHSYHNEQTNAFLEANKELNIPVPIDYNGKQQLGAAYTQFNSIRGRRDSSSGAFLDPVKNRTNLKISNRSYVVKLLINNESKVLQGLLFTKFGRLFKVTAREEVIISTGSIKSPHILMVSGIGPADELKKHGIPVIQDLAVGYNFQDHAAFYGGYFVTNYTAPSSSLKTYVKEYLNGTGPLTMPGNIQVLGFYQVNTTNNTHVPGFPNLELLLWASNDSNSYLQRSFGYTDETFKALFGKMDIQRTFLLEVIMLHPKSTGRITLKSASPYDYPIIDPNLLSDPEGHDIDIIYSGIQFILQLTKTKAFQKINTTLLYAPLPQCKHHKYLSKTYWYCTIKHLTYNLFHPIGSCKMGPDPKEGAVVDSTLKVHGIKKLRVADASIIPRATSGHTSAPSIMIGERVSSFIKNERGCKSKI